MKNAFAQISKKVFLGLNTFMHVSLFVLIVAFSDANTTNNVARHRFINHARHWYCEYKMIANLLSICNEDIDAIKKHSETVEAKVSYCEFGVNRFSEQERCNKVTAHHMNDTTTRSTNKTRRTKAMSANDSIPINAANDSTLNNTGNGTEHDQ